MLNDKDCRTITKHWIVPISNCCLYCRMVNMDVEGGFLSPSSRAPLQKHESETSELLQSNLPLLFANGVPTSLESMTLVRV